MVEWNPDPAGTVQGQQAKKVAELVVAGESPTVAAEVVGVSWRSVQEQVKREITRYLESYAADDEVQKSLVKARLTQFLLSEDPELAMAAIRETKKLHGMDQAPVLQLRIGEPPPEAQRAIDAATKGES